MEDLIIPFELHALLSRCAMFIGDRRDNGKNKEAVFLFENLIGVMSKMRMSPVDLHEYERFFVRVLFEKVF